MGSGTVDGAAERHKTLTLCERKCASFVSCIRILASLKISLKSSFCQSTSKLNASRLRRRVIFHFLGDREWQNMYVPCRERDRVSDGEDVRDLQTISLSCWWCYRHIFQDVAACGPRLCLSRMTPFTSIHHCPARPPLTLGLSVCPCGKKWGRARFR